MPHLRPRGAFSYSYGPHNMVSCAFGAHIYGVLGAIGYNETFFCCWGGVGGGGGGGGEKPYVL